ncbi:proclotting enzyme-like [Penaeus chinensis]|uniref:proclotting enzyme-like n=1 Tax=Penaeus chinensis TaxID=139456 RepID=UPI001FB77341|nr:proclotting enzyme-like [Penaeus chinensis]
MHSSVPALWWVAILVSSAVPSNSLRGALDRIGRVDSVTKAPLPPPVSPVLPRSLSGGGEAGSPHTLRLKTESAIPVSLLAPVDECDVTVALDNGEAALLYSRSDRYEYTCKQTFTTVDPRANLTVTCQHFRLKFNCFFESLTIEVDGKASTYCMDDKVGQFQGRNVSLSFERNFMGFNGGYVCTVSCQGPPSALISEDPGCPTCGVTVAMESRQSKTADERIVGGVSTVKGAFPWMAHLRITARPSMQYMCGGSLITDTHILSAAHCFEYDVQYIDVTLGMVDTRIVLAGDLVRMQATDFTVHAKYDSDNIYNDIAVVKLPRAVTFTDVIRPICLPTSADTMEGAVATATGWGTLSFGGEEAQVLQKVDLDVWSNTMCSSVWSRKYMTIASTQVCALGDGKDTCSGDSGGPLAVQVDGKYVQLGITSYGQGCATPGVPGVYTRVSSYMTWIKAHVEGYCQGGGAERK